MPDPDSGPARQFKLRLLCKDEAKGPVTALCGINGYLVSSMGQKVGAYFAKNLALHADPYTLGRYLSEH